MYRCTNDPTHKEFYGTEFGRCSYSCTVEFDENGDSEDSDNYEHGDYSSDEIDDRKCRICDADAEWYDENEPAKKGWKDANL